jgi:hypothetical protein
MARLAPREIDTCVGCLRTVFPYELCYFREAGLRISFMFALSATT